MLRQMNWQVETESMARAEGDLHKIIHVEGVSFPLHYGYYDECDRNNPLVDPMPIYPDFLENPQYTPQGFPFVTKMQDACSHYLGEANGCEECAECAWYRHGQELLGICCCPDNRRAGQETKGVK